MNEFSESKQDNTWHVTGKHWTGPTCRGSDKMWAPKIGKNSQNASFRLFLFAILGLVLAMKRGVLASVPPPEIGKKKAKCKSSAVFRLIFGAIFRPFLLALYQGVQIARPSNVLPPITLCSGHCRAIGNVHGFTPKFRKDMFRKGKGTQT